ncbi:MAG: glycosyltransferase family 2 protein [Chitinophagaceae bacterium]
MLQLSIIIVNYNVKYFLEHCLYSLQKAARSLKAEIIVVDNASSDGSMEYLLNKFPEVNFIDNPVNTGFAKANNQALKQARGKFILFLNPDTIVPEDCLEQSIRLMESNLQIGACGVKMIDGRGHFLPESKRSFPTLESSFYKLSGLSSLFPASKLFAGYYLGHLPENRNSEIEVLSGAYLMTRKEVLQKTGGFDERFFMYGEDIDLSIRIQQEGYKNFYLAETCIIHFKGESTRKGNLNYVRLFYKAMSLFVEKHYKAKNVKGLSFLIETSIWFSAGLSATKNILLYKKPSTKKVFIKTLLIAAEKEKEKVASILEKQYQDRNIHHISLIEDWKQWVLLQKPDEIIFVQGTLSYKEIISRMQELPNGITISIYSIWADSIVGSRFKNTPGHMLV